MAWAGAAAFLLLLILKSKNRVFLRFEMIGFDLTLHIRFSLLDGWISLPIVYTYRPLAEGKRARLFVSGREKPLDREVNKGRKDAAHVFVRSIIRHGRVKRLRSSFLLGAQGNAALTARACGAFLAAFSTLTALLKARQRGIRTQTAVTPDFGKSAFVLSLSCMIELSFGHIMEAAMNAMFSRRKGAKA